MLRKFLQACLVMAALIIINAAGLNNVAQAATRQPLSRDYINSCFTSIAAASCLGVYLPQDSLEFNYLRSYGWDITPQTETDGNVVANFAIAHNSFPELDQEVYLVTFRGTSTKKDWGINLKTAKVAYGGASIGEMEAFAKAPLNEHSPAIHEGFNEYVNTVLRASVVDESSNLKGVFAEVLHNPKAYMILTGHSLGGAAATLLGERLRSLGMPKEKFKVVTFGAPAIGNQEFADTYGDNIDLIRVTNTADPIPGSLQTLFGNYKQFGTQVKYSLPATISEMQHSMAMYFDYSVSRYYEEFDKQAALDRVHPLPDKRLEGSEPVVALWVFMPEHLKQVARFTDLHRYTMDTYKKMFPNYMVMDPKLRINDNTRDLLNISRDAGADYIVLVGVDGKRPKNDKHWYLTLEQSSFSKDGRMLTMSSSAKKVAPSVGNIQALGEHLYSARAELQQQMPFIRTKYEYSLYRP